MQEVLLDYGDGKMRVELPDSATVFQLSKLDADPPSVDPAAAVRRALDKPLGLPPLKELGGPGKKVVIGFPDRVKGGAHAQSHRKTALPMIIADLVQAGTRVEDITLLCAVGLHRHNTYKEWCGYLGKELVDRFWPDRIVNHDAEAPDLCDFGQDDMGNVVQVNRLLYDADLCVVLGHVAGNPYGGYSGGYKMLVTGHTGWRSIASHHNTKTMHRRDWLGASPHSHMRKQFRSIGEAIEKGLGKRIFAVDAVLGKKSQVLDVKAGALDQVETATWPLADRRTNHTLQMSGQADILVMGLPRNFHYGPGMGTNPCLMSLAIGGQLSRCWHAVREGGVIIAAAECDGWFNDLWFPSYAETYDSLQKYCSIPEFLESEEMLRISTKYEYRFRYSHHYAYHPFHAMSMISGGSIPAAYMSATFIAGAKAPAYARGMGFIPTSTFAEALRKAERYVGAHPKILCTPDCFTGGMGVHLRMPK